jgi:putative membrane protein
MTHAKWGLAAAMGAILAMAEPAGAQGPNTGATADPGNPKTTDTRAPGERSGWSGHEANTAGSASDKGSGSSVGGSTTASTTPDPSTTGAGSSSGASSSHKSSDSSSSMSGTGSSTDTSASGASSASSGKMDKGLMEGLQKLHAANQGEVQMGQMGAQMAQDPQVKQFAQQMVDDHSKNDQQLTSMAQTMGIQLTGKDFQDKQKEAQKDMQKVQGKTGAEFDKAYMDQMVKDHEKDVKEVGKLAKKAHDAKQTELASMLDQTHSKMQSHLDMAKQIQKSTKDQAKSAGRSGSSSSMGTGSSGSDSKSSHSTSDSSTSGTGSSSSKSSGTDSSTGASSPSTSSGSSGTSGSDTSK